MQQITKQQIDSAIRQIEHHEAVVERFKEHPQYVQFQELAKIQQNGAFIAHTIANEEKLVEELKQRVGQMINIMNQQKQQAPPQQAPPQQKQPMPQMQQPQQPQQPQQLPQPTPQPTPQIDPLGNPIHQQPQPTPPPQPQERTPEQQAEELFKSTQEELGTDEKIDGLPDIEDLPDFEEPEQQQQQ